MAADYFHQLHKETPTRFWVNNPSGAEMERAIAAGAVNCTTNPAYCSKLLASKPDYIRGVVDGVISEETHDAEQVAVRGYHTTLLGGGARGTHHFTEMVGGDMHITINWSTAQEIIDVGTPVVPRMDVETPQAVINELTEKLPDFRKAFDEDGLSVEEFAGYGPVQFFRNAFLKGWYLLLAEIPAQRNVYAL